MKNFRKLNRLVEPTSTNQVLQRKSAIGRVQSVIQTSSLSDDLVRVFRELRGQAVTPRHQWVDAFSEDSPDESLAATNEKMVDLWAVHQVDRAMQRGARQEASQIAAAHHIVSQVSGAVVLETDEQFKAAGLVPVDQADKTPMTTPEPATGMVAAFGLLGLLDWHRRRGRGLSSRR